MYVIQEDIFFFFFFFYDNFTYMSNMFFQLLAWESMGWTYDNLDECMAIY